MPNTMCRTGPAPVSLHAAFPGTASTSTGHEDLRQVVGGALTVPRSNVTRISGFLSDRERIQKSSETVRFPNFLPEEPEISFVSGIPNLSPRPRKQGNEQARSSTARAALGGRGASRRGRGPPLVPCVPRCVRAQGDGCARRAELGYGLETLPCMRPMPRIRESYSEVGGS